MNYIQTFYIAPNQNAFKDRFGWISPLYHLLSWGLSACTLRASLGKLKLFTNQKGKEILIDMLHLPYDDVELIFDNWTLPHPDLWALSKIYTYSWQTKPFIHIDGDIYLFQNFSESFIKSPLVAQNMEQFTDYYYSIMRPINRRFVYMPKIVQSDFRTLKQLRAVNAGILGGCDTDFFKQYTEEATKYVYANLNSLHEIDANRFNVFFEQHLFYNMAKAQNIPITYFLEQEYHDNAYLGLDKFYEIPSGKSVYFHLLGNYKRDWFTCQQMAMTLHALYPEVYHRILDLYQKNNSNINIEIKSHNGAYTLDLVSYINAVSRQLLKENLSKEQYDDFLSFRKEVLDYVEELRVVNIQLGQRDKEAFWWYEKIFHNNDDSIKIVQEQNVKIVKSRYDWCRLLLRERSSGIKYYSSFSVEKLQEGDFYGIIIPDSIYTIALYDIEDVEYLLFNILSSPKTLSEIYTEFCNYIDGDIDSEFNKKIALLIHNSLKRLILFKAIKPNM